MTIHEFAHGLTLKHFGGKVDEMGFMILYFIPAFYCNVSDAWMLKKRERILVSFAGGYVQFFIWALATICWRFLAIETLASRVCLITIAFCGIQTFLNFNPLIRLDGYYILSDFLEVPNLRPKAIAYVKNRIRSLLTGNTFQEQEGLNAREKRLFFFYGTASALFTCILIWIMVQRLGGWIVHEYHFWGILLVSVLFFMAMPGANKENRTCFRKRGPNSEATHPKISHRSSGLDLDPDRRFPALGAEDFGRLHDNRIEKSIRDAAGFGESEKDLCRAGQAGPREMNCWQKSKIWSCQTAMRKPRANWPRRKRPWICCWQDPARKKLKRPRGLSKPRRRNSIT